MQQMLLISSLRKMKSFRERVGSFTGPSAIAERGEYELDEEANDLEDPPRPNTFLARVVEAAEEEEEEHGDV
ncbi:hypothetical protein Taro_037485 [Colocasia esculenta]|uniref:Uncharacterized protein n=1 Tax=Colocasia esculenta TaxID=4460 RepID=A0A843W4A4_COLES|nr:hypothetical protein [Colocasia esculenta]